ncbi:MAG: Hsp20/alpha crystallin family protein [Clostridiaceae bacterium]|nr:Hsp20/alpha crystallin family protein [Clostridiaceae bacterium]
MFSLVPHSWRRGILSRKDDFFGIDRFFEDFFRDPFFSRWSAMTSPIRTDVRETEKEYIIEAEMPGVKKEDIIIDLKDNELTLGVDVKNETNKEDNGYICRERHLGSYRRSFHVGNIDNENVKASYKDGLLTVILPKDNRQDKGRRIKID